MATDLNISVGLVDVTRKAPRLVSSGEILWERVQLTGLVVIHPLWLLLHRLWSVGLMDLRVRDKTRQDLGRAVPWVDSGNRSEVAPYQSSPPCSYRRLPGSSCTL